MNTLAELRNIEQSQMAALSLTQKAIKSLEKEQPSPAKDNSALHARAETSRIKRLTKNNKAA